MLRKIVVIVIVAILTAMPVVMGTACSASIDTRYDGK